MKKICTCCGEERDAEQDFNWKYKSRGIRNTRCKFCLSEASKRHYQKNKQIYKKYCSGCDRDLGLEDFAWKYKARGIRQDWCKQCLKEANRSHYLNNALVYKARAAERNERVRAENRQRLFAYLSTRACIDCGNSDIRVLDFDHVREEKLANIARMLQYSSWPCIEDEIAKCEVRCANCHRIKTIERGQWWRLAYAPEKEEEA